MFNKIDHVEITTPNMNESLTFYTEILGFKLERKKTIVTDFGSTVIAHLSLNGYGLELIEINKELLIPKSPYLGYRMMALTVDDMDNAIKYLKENGVTIRREPVKMSKEDRGGFRGEFLDNNGVPIEIRQL